MQESWHLLQWPIWGLVMALTMRWLAKSRSGRSSATGPKVGVLVHPKSTLIVGIVITAFFLSIAVISNTVAKNSSTTLWTTLVFVGFGLLSALMIADYFFGRHLVILDGLEYGGMFGRRGVARRGQVRSVSYSPRMKWFVLSLDSGRKVRVSAMLVGLPEFARLVLLGVPQDRIDGRTLHVLRNTAEGRLPDLWK